MEFSPQINKFQTLGVYDYKFDEAGNVIANSASADFSYNYLGLMLMDSVYDNKSIESYYDVNFTEFNPATSNEPSAAPTALQQNNDQLLLENDQLKTRIDNLIIASESDSTMAKNDAMKRVILDLRIALKQGKEDRDFSDVFPYTAKADK